MMGNKQKPHSFNDWAIDNNLVVLMTRIKRWATDNNLIPDAQFGSTADCIFTLKTCMHVKLPEQQFWTLVLLILVNLLIESVKIAWKAQTQWKDEKHIRDHLQAWNREKQLANCQTWSQQEMEQDKDTHWALYCHLLFPSWRVHWSNNRHISNELPTVCNQTTVVNLA